MENLRPMLPENPWFQKKKREKKSIMNLCMLVLDRAINTNLRTQDFKHGQVTRSSSVEFDNRFGWPEYSGGHRVFDTFLLL